MSWSIWGGIAIGAVLGAWLRYGFALLLNPVFPTLPLGTVAANLLGGFLMGIVISNFPPYMGLPVEMRLAFATGFLGGLTTFSTFDAES
ncbi:MAG: CrcB family protein, partial [Betaproteobacteria bacterium]|nr:CrcB family protein [Betaproteobacteria bacterium]